MQEKECNSDELLKYRTVFDATLDGLILLDEDRKIVDVNKAALKILGYPEEEMIGKDLVDFRALEDIDKCTQAFAEAKSGKRISCDCAFMGNKGERIYTDDLLSQIKIEGKYYVVISFHDISSIKELQDDLEKEVKKLRKLNSMMVGREERMIELKKEMKNLEEKEGKCKCD